MLFCQTLNSQFSNLCSQKCTGCDEKFVVLSSVVYGVLSVLILCALCLCLYHTCDVLCDKREPHHASRCQLIDVWGVVQRACFKQNNISPCSIFLGASQRNDGKSQSGVNPASICRRPAIYAERCKQIALAIMVQRELRPLCFFAWNLLRAISSYPQNGPSFCVSPPPIAIPRGNHISHGSI